ncbi:MAG: hypothetical protein KME27_10165 [Lyngbya sp. HA4199-MV5]|nr:hypothetical protein [Lyngbya sp. HA4199-MV5]
MQHLDSLLQNTEHSRDVFCKPAASSQLKSRTIINLRPIAAYPFQRFAMSEASNLFLLFAQLQARYPASGLLTELVQIHADHFVVRAIVQLGNMTLATSLAAASTVEQAEDQARLRVLALLGIHSSLHPLSIAVPEVPFSTSSATIVPEHPFQEATLPAVSLNSVAHPSTVSSIALPDRDATIAPSPAFPLPAIAPTPLTDLPKTSFSTATVESPVPTLDRSEMPLEAWEAPLDEAPPDDEDVPYDDAPYDEEPYDEPEPFVAEAPDRTPSTNDLPTAPEAPTTKSKPRKPSADKETPAADAGTSGGASRDLSSLISQIGVEIDRIGWSKRQGSTYLQKTYGKKTRSELTDDELEDFLTYLNTQPSAESRE